MGNVCSCGSHDAEDGGERVVKQAPAPPRTALAAQQKGAAARGASANGFAVASQEAARPSQAAGDGQGVGGEKLVKKIKVLVQQTMHASRGDLRAAEEEEEDDDEAEEEGGGSAAAAADDSEAWHDALGDLQLEDVLSKWDEDQATTLQRLDRALEVCCCALKSSLGGGGALLGGRRRWVEQPGGSCQTPQKPLLSQSVLAGCE